LQESVTQGKKYEMQTESTVANQAAAWGDNNFASYEVKN
jgi:hypothetical protein